MAQGEEAARVRVPAPLGAGQQKYSYCLILHILFTTVYIMKIRNLWAKPLTKPASSGYK
jgi:hypothetical protein